ALPFPAPSPRSRWWRSPCSHAGSTARTRRQPQPPATEAAAEGGTGLHRTAGAKGETPRWAPRPALPSAGGTGDRCDDGGMVGRDTAFRPLAEMRIENLDLAYRAAPPR